MSTPASPDLAPPRVPAFSVAMASWRSAVLVLAVATGFFPAVGKGAALEFDTSGRLRQLESTARATQQGVTIVGVCSGSHVLLMSWNAKEPLEARPLSIPGRQYLWDLDEDQVLAGAGLANDVRVLVDHARQMALQHRALSGTPERASRLAQGLATRLHGGTVSTGRRPFAADLVLAAADGVHRQPILLQISPMGSIRRFQAVAIGANAAFANEVLLRRLANDAEKSSLQEMPQAAQRTVKSWLSAQGVTDKDMVNHALVAFEALTAAATGKAEDEKEVLQQALEALKGGFVKFAFLRCGVEHTPHRPR